MSTPEKMAQWMWSALKVNVLPEIEPSSVPPELVTKEKIKPQGGGRDIAKEIEAAEGRLYRELDSGADRPSDILDRRAYVNSEIRALRKSVDQHAGDDEKAALHQRIDEMEQTVAQTEAAGMQRALAALQKDLEDAQESVDLATSLVDMDDRKGAYKLASEAAAKIFLSETDWQAQLKQGRSLPGIGTLSKPFEALRKQRELLDDLVGQLLPKLNSKIKQSPPNGTQIVENAPQDCVIEEGKELQAILDCGGDWADAKAKYGRYKKEMLKLSDFRKEVVDAWLEKNLHPWNMKKDAGWVAVGSNDPTSDYDISINMHGIQGEGRAQKVYYDYQIVKDFNAHFRQKYGCETGTIFDTNLYAAAPSLVPGPPEDGTEQEK